MHRQALSTSPLVRISTCGHLTVEVLQEGEPSSDGHVPWVYRPPTLPSNGGTTAFNLLKLLVSQPGRFATKDWLTEKLRPNKSEDEEWAGLARLDNIVSLLRGVLCPVEKQQSGEKQHKKPMGRLLVEYVAPTPESGSGYRLAPYPLIWLDVEAISTHVKRACQLEAEEQDAWAEWQAAYQISNQGPFLSEGRYSDWAVGRREEVEGYLWQSVQALWRQAMRQPEEAGEEEALRLLREYWLRHPEHEDALRPLIELLGKRGDYQRAEAYYAKLCGLLNEEGKEPDRRTLKTMHFLRSSQQHLLPLGREEEAQGPFSPVIPAIPQEREPSAHLGSSISQVTRTSSSFNQQDEETHAFFSPLTIQNIMGIVSESEKENAQNGNPLRQATTIGILSLLGRKVLSPEWWERLAHPHPSAMNAEAFIYFQQLLEIGWGLSNAGELHAAEHVVMSFLPRIFQLAPHQKEAASIAAEGLRLRGILAAHQLRIADKLVFSLQSVEYARQTSDPNILVAELTELAAAFEYAQQLENSFKTHQEALPFAEQASPLIRSRFYGRSAIAFARKGHIKEALSYIDLAYDNLPEHPENEQNFLSSDHGSYKLARHKGLMYLSIGKLAEAEKAFESIACSSSTAVPERSRLEIVNDKGRIAILSNNLTKYAEYLEEGIGGSLLLKSQKRFDEALTIYQQEMPKAWQNERPIKQIVEHFHI